MIKVLPILILSCFANQLFSQKINLKVDAQNAIQVFQYLNTQNTSVTNAKSILHLEGTQGMINHDGLFDKEISAENFIKEISDSAATKDAFRFKEIRNDLSNIKKTITLLTANVDNITNRIEQNLLPYLTTIDSKPIRVYFILGGNSDGYTANDSTFYLELHFFGDDLEGIINIITHEVYHILQQRSYPFSEQIYAELPKRQKGVYLLSENIYIEGSASYIANPVGIKNPKRYALFQQEKYARNLKKIKESFYLFETLLTMAKSKKVNEGLLYNIGYGGNWDSPLYFVGYKICEELEKVYGKYYIKKYLTQSPVKLLTDYILLYKQNPKIKNRFSIKTEKTLFRFIWTSLKENPKNSKRFHLPISIERVSELKLKAIAFILFS